jgi:hypothetical protein
MSTLNQAFSVGGGLATEATLEQVRDAAVDILADTAALDTKTPTLGQKNMAGSSPVVISSDQSAVPVSGPLTDTQLRATAVPVSGPLTDTELRATAVPVSGPLTDTELRAAAVPISAAALPLPSGAAEEATLASIATDAGNSAAFLNSIDGKTPTLGQKAMVNSVPVVLASDQSPVSTSPVTPVAGTVKQAAITVGTSAVRLTTDGSAPDATRRMLAFRPDPDSSAKFYYGGSSVTSSGPTRGMQVFPGESIERESDAGDYYIISDMAGQTVFVVEQE